MTCGVAVYKLIIILWTTKFNAFNRFDPFGNAALTHCRMDFNSIPVSGFKMRSLVRGSPLGFARNGQEGPQQSGSKRGSDLENF